MFTVSAFKLIRRNCPEDLDKLLKLLEVDKKPNWDRDDEFKIAQELDRRIDKKLCALLDSNSDIAMPSCSNVAQWNFLSVKLARSFWKKFSPIEIKFCRLL